MCLGWVVRSHATDGILLVNQQNHSVNSFRVRTSAHIGDDLQVDGNLTVLGTQTTVSTADVTAGSPFFRLNEGNAIGEAGTSFSGSGLDDAFFAGFMKGPTPQTYYVRIDGVGSGPGGVDTFKVALGNDAAFASPIITTEPITGDPQMIHSTDNISVEFGATTGHTLNDTWTGTASPINIDTGFFTNRNTGSTGVGFTYMGIFYDVSDDKWKLVDEYDSNPAGTINTGDASFSLGDLVANQFEGNLIGDVQGDVTGIVSSIANHSTSDLSEGSNLYFTDERVDDRVNSLVQDGDGITTTYDDAANTLTFSIGNDAIKDTMIDFGTGANQVSTDDVPEGSTNEYYLKSRVDSDIAASLQDSGNVVNVTVNQTIGSTVDSAYVVARVGAAPFLDSADLTSGSFTGNISATGFTGTLQTAAQPNITSVGNLTALRVDGEIDARGGITDDGGNLELQASNGNHIILKNHAGNTIIRAKNGGSADLRHSGNIKLETNAYGVTVTGTVDADSATLTKLTVSGNNAKGVFGSFAETSFPDPNDRPLILVDSNATMLIHRIHPSFDAALEMKVSDSPGADLDVYWDIFAKKSDKSFVFRDRLANPAHERLIITHSDSNAQVRLGDSSDLFIPDKGKILPGNDNDLQIFHNGSFSQIRDTGPGNIAIDASGLSIRNAAGTETILSAHQNTGVSLYKNNNKKFETTDYGATVTGTLNADSATLTGTITAKAFHSSAQQNFTTFTADNDLIIKPGVSKDFYVKTTGNQNLIKAVGGGANTRVELYHQNDLRISTTAYGATVTGTINADSATITGDVSAATFTGSGANLTDVDAATLDGIDNLSFLRSDADDSFSGTLMGVSDGTNPTIGIRGGGPNFIRFYDTLDASNTTNAVDIVYRRTPNDLLIERSGSANKIAEFGGDDGHAALYFNNSKKLETTNYGATVTGTINADSATFTTFTSTIAGGTAPFTVTSSTKVDNLNADFLDGVSIGNLLRSDVADTKTNGYLAFSDNVKLLMGTGHDLEIYHDGNNSIIKDNGDGYLQIEGQALGQTAGDVSELLSLVSTNANTGRLRIFQERDANGTSWTSAYTRIQQIIDVTDMGYIQFNGQGEGRGMELGTDGDEKFIKMIHNGAVELYHNDIKKLETTAYGATVTGTINADSATLTNLTLSTGTSVNEFSVDGTLAGNSDDAVPTEKAVKTYVDGQISADVIRDSADVLGVSGTGSFTGVSGSFSVNQLNVGSNQPVSLVVYKDTTTATTQFAIFSISTSNEGAFKVMITAKRGSDRQVSEITATHDGTTAVATEYSMIMTNGILANYDVDVNGGLFRLLATPTSASSTTFVSNVTFIEA